MELFQFEFFRNALAGIAIIAVASAIIGTYIFTRRLISIAGGITHACFGGLGLGYFLGVSPILMAGLFAAGSSLGVEYASRNHRVREDSAIAVVWSLGMAIGVLFVFLTPGNVPELNAFLFGNILTITRMDLLLFGIYTLLLMAFVVWKFDVVIACAFDSDFARVSGLPVVTVTTIMTMFVAVGIVLTIKLVGVMLLMAMLSLPQMIAETRVNRVGKLMKASALVSLVTCVGGLFATAFIDVPCSALIVILQATVFLIARLTARRK